MRLNARLFVFVGLLFMFAFSDACYAGVRVNRGQVEEYVDLIELNHFYDSQGRHVYDQVIFYEEDPGTLRRQVRAWCLVEDRDTRNRRPVKNVETSLYQVDWFDNDQRLVRKITSRSFSETWSQIDPERANKKVLLEKYRIALIQNPKKLAQAGEQEKQERQRQEEERREQERLEQQRSAIAAMLEEPCEPSK